ncbi:hypothetical protein BVG19_g5472 [[Candida] boidinii]|nr:hypothetical protein BVG19_g5472 [[Candida] boidinii]OWB53952.1 hypothetical protein B5S27_g5569 [[Candida] boidinii]
MESDSYVSDTDLSDHQLLSSDEVEAENEDSQETPELNQTSVATNDKQIGKRSFLKPKKSLKIKRKKLFKSNVNNSKNNSDNSQPKKRKISSNEKNNDKSFRKIRQNAKNLIKNLEYNSSNDLAIHLLSSFQLRQNIQNLNKIPKHWYSWPLHPQETPIPESTVNYLIENQDRKEIEKSLIDRNKIIKNLDTNNNNQMKSRLAVSELNFEMDSYFQKLIYDTFKDKDNIDNLNSLFPSLPTFLKNQLFCNLNNIIDKILSIKFRRSKNDIIDWRDVLIASGIKLNSFSSKSDIPPHILNLQNAIKKIFLNKKILKDQLEFKDLFIDTNESKVSIVDKLNIDPLETADEFKSYLIDETGNIESGNLKWFPSSSLNRKTKEKSSVKENEELLIRTLIKRHYHKGLLLKHSQKE